MFRIYHVKIYAGIDLHSSNNYINIITKQNQKLYGKWIPNDGLKHTDDKWDAFWLAHILRLDILPEGYIYPKPERPLRDLLRRRLLR